MSIFAIDASEDADAIYDIPCTCKNGDSHERCQVKMKDGPIYREYGLEMRLTRECIEEEMLLAPLHVEDSLRRCFGLCRLSFLMWSRRLRFLIVRLAGRKKDIVDTKGTR